jgi:hypothetical protein
MATTPRPGWTRLTIDIENELYARLRRHLVSLLERESRKIKLAEFAREALTEKLAKEEKRKSVR